MILRQRVSVNSIDDFYYIYYSIFTKKHLENIKTDPLMKHSAYLLMNKTIPSIFDNKSNSIDCTLDHIININ